MGYKVELFVPTHQTEELGPLIGRIAGKWGGVTVSQEKGWWINGAGDLVPDDVSILKCSVPSWTASTRRWWYDLATTVAKCFEQDRVLLNHRLETAILIDRDGNVETIGD